MTTLAGFSLVERLPLTQGWHLLLTIAAGMIVVAVLHRIACRRAAQLTRARQINDSESS